MCCGQKRATLTQENFKRTPPASVQTPAPVAAQPIPNAQRATAPQPHVSWSSVRLRYLQTSPIRVRGSVTGTHYEFSAANPVAAVDARDAESLVGTRFFAKAG